LRLDNDLPIRTGTSSQLSDVIAELGATKAFIITGRSLYEKTPVIKNIEKTLGSAHGGTFSKIGQHAYVGSSHIQQRSSTDMT
jgi:3-oxoacid CoA-transferase